MGSNRKRLPGERPTSPSSSRDDKKRDGKPRKKKDKKKNKDGSSSLSDHHQHKSSLETTATAEGQIMAQVMSTFSRLEQSRFEAFRRAAFPKDAIAKYVAHCLIEEQHRPVSTGGIGTAGVVATKSNTQQSSLPTKKPPREPILSEVVAPGQAEDITIIVSTLAKAYAQRLVTAARRHAAIRSSAEAAAAATNNKDQARPTPTNLFASPTKGTGGGGGGKPIGKNLRGRSIHPASAPSTTSTTNATTAITPEDLMKAFEERKAQGLDPGFFLQPWKQSQSVLVENNVYQQKRLAALHAQELYDKQHGGPPNEEDDDNDGEKVETEGLTTDAYDDAIWTPSKDEAIPMDTSSPS